MTRAQGLSNFASGLGNTLKVDDTNNRVGINSSIPTTTLDVGGSVTATSAAVSDLTSGRVVIAGTSGELEDDSRLLYNTSTGIFSVAGAVDINDSIRHRGNTNTRIRFPAADTFTVETAGLERLRVDSSGRLLVGQTSAINGIFGSTPPRFSVSTTTASPSIFGTYSNNTYASRIDLVKSRSATVGSHTVVQAGDALGELYFGGSDGDQYQPAALIQSVVESGVGNNDMPADLRFFTNGGSTAVTERLRIDQSGFITQKFTSNNSTTAEGLFINNQQNTTGNNASLIFSNDSGNRKKAALALIDTGDYGSGDLVFALDSADSGELNLTNDEKLRIDSSGRLLLGTSSAVSSSSTELLQVIPSNGEGASIVIGRNDSTVSEGNAIGLISFVGNDGGSYQTCAQILARADGTHAANDKPTRLVFSTTADGASSPTERMRILSDGEVRTYSNTSNTSFRNSNAAATTNAFITGLYGASGVSSGGTVSLRIWTNGNIQNTNNSYGSLSDIKLKENIVDANSQWADIKDLRVRNYNFIEGQTHTQLGLVAQEVETVSPGLVSESPDQDGEGNDLGTTTKSVNYSVLYMKAVKALQEAMTRIETLEKRLSDAGIA